MVFAMEKSQAAILGHQYVRTVDYRVLGPFEVLVDGVSLPLGGPKPRGVVAVLVAVAGRPVSVDSLLQATYGEDAAPTSRATLQTYVSNLRHALGDVIVRQGDAYFVDCTNSTIDAAAFEDAYRTASVLSDAEDVSARLREALAMWRGHPYADIEAHGFLDGEITRLTELRLAALENRIDADLRAGRHREVIAELDALTVEHPFRENLRALHMLALYRSGRQGEALRAFGHTRAALAEGLGIDPSLGLKELQRRILDQDRTLLAVAGPTVRRCAVVVADVDDSGWRDPAEREIAFSRRESELASAAGRTDGVKLAPKGTAGYAIFSQPIHAVQAARQVVNERTRVAVDFGDLEMREDEPVGPPLARVARLVAVAHPGQVLLSSTAHDALTAGGGSGWAAESLGSFDIIGLDAGLHIYQLVGNGFTSDFPELLIDRLPPAVPSAVERSVPGYELRSVIGIGQLGEVHRAYQPSVGREVALRIFGPGIVGHPQFVRRFETASQRVSRVEHPHVVPLLDYWREPNRAVMVSRLMTGGHLGQRIPSSGFDTADALAIFETVASGIASSHRHGVAHGRIRPQNVLFDDEDNAFVADLGVDEICTGIITFATDAYDAPERLGGALATPATDVYSLGILLHHLFGGSPPPQDGTLSLGEGAVDRVVARATDPDPRRRQSSVDELAAELREALTVPVDPTTAFVPTRNPYRGLAAFEQADADDFHGRERAVGQMVDVLEQERLLVVVGPSGIGKSSGVKAGLLPALANGALAGSETWLVAEMVPGQSPFERLAAALGRVATVAPPDVAGELAASVRSLDDVARQLLPDGTELVVVVDQFEELFTQTIDDHERRAFLKMIVDIASGASGVVRLVATLRADYFDRPLGYPGVGDAIKGRTVAVGAMTDDELADAVRLPAAGVGVEIEPALVDRITTEAALQPGALPLVQHTMVELFAGRQSNVITLAAFDEAGGLAGAIGRRAEAIYAGFDDQRRDATRRVFLRLVNVGEDRDDTRRRVRRTELEQLGISADDLQAVLDEYGRHRLLTFDRDPTSRTPTVEVAHESLLAEWERFAGWVDDARDDLLTRRRLESAAHDWMSSGSDPSFLYGGGRLELAESWAAGSGFELTDDEHRFLATSRAKVDRDQVVRTRRRRIIVGLLAAALVVAIVGAAVALVQRSSAERQANRADSAARDAQVQASRAAAAAENEKQQAGRADAFGRLAEARRIGTQALVEDDYDQALFLAVEGRHLEDSPETQANLLATIQRSPDAIAVIRSETEAFLDIGFAPDGKTLLTSGVGAPSTLSKYDVTTREREASVDGLNRISSAVSADGRLAVMSDLTSSPAGDDIFKLHFVDTATFTVVGDPLRALPYEWPTRLSFSPDGRYIAAVTDQYLSGAGLSSPIALVWDVSKGGRPVVRYPFSAENFQRDVAFLPDSKRILVAGADGTAIVDIASGRKVGQIDGAHPPIAVSPDGGTLAAATDVRQGVVIGLFDLTSGKLSTVLAGHRERLLRLAFSPDGTQLASGADDRVVMVWDVATGERSAVYEGHAAAVNDVAFSPDGKTLWSAGEDRAIFVWDLQRAHTLVHRASPAVADGPTLPFNSADTVIGPGGRYVAYPAADDGHFQIRDVATGALGRPSRFEDGWFVSFSPDGTRYVTINDEGRLRVWDTKSGAVLADSNGSRQFFSTNPMPVAKAVFTPDGRGVVALEVGKTSEKLVVLDATTLAPVGGEPVPLRSVGRTVAVMPDGRQAVVVANTPGQGVTKVLLVDLETRTIVRSTRRLKAFDLRQNGPRNNTLAPDGRSVGIGGTGGDVVVVDAVTGEVSPVLPAHDGFVESVTFAPDGATFVTTGQDGALKLWDTATWRVLDTVEPFGANHRIRASFLARDRLMIVDDTGQILEWDPRPDAWEAYACTVAGRNLTHEDWGELFPGEPYRVTCPDFPAGE
jgi:WD40 repeat protein/DNA-binding SARP family transcriptional activator